MESECVSGIAETAQTETLAVQEALWFCDAQPAGDAKTSDGDREKEYILALRQQVAHLYGEAEYERAVDVAEEIKERLLAHNAGTVNIELWRETTDMRARCLHKLQRHGACLKEILAMEKHKKNKEHLLGLSHLLLRARSRAATGRFAAASRDFAQAVTQGAKSKGHLQSWKELAACFELWAKCLAQNPLHHILNSGQEQAEEGKEVTSLPQPQDVLQAVWLCYFRLRYVLEVKTGRQLRDKLTVLQLRYESASEYLVSAAQVDAALSATSAYAYAPLANKQDTYDATELTALFERLRCPGVLQQLQVDRLIKHYSYDLELEGPQLQEA
jgi:hypothetical protein